MIIIKVITKKIKNVNNTGYLTGLLQKSYLFQLNFLCKPTNFSPRWIVVGGRWWHSCAADDTVDLLLRGRSGGGSGGSRGRSGLRCVSLLVLLSCHSQQPLHSLSTFLKTLVRDSIVFCEKPYTRQR